MILPFPQRAKAKLAQLKASTQDPNLSRISLTQANTFSWTLTYILTLLLLPPIRIKASAWADLESAVTAWEKKKSLCGSAQAIA